MIKQLYVVLSVLSLVGCSDPLTEFVNAKFPPISVEDQRIVAIRSTADALATVHVPSVGIGVSIADANAMALPESLTKEGITRLKIIGEKQLLRIEASFERTFEGKDAGSNADAAKILDSLKPKISGDLTIYAGITSGVATASPTPVIEFKLLPAISTVKVRELQVAGKSDVSVAGETIADLLNKFKDNISGEIARNPLTSVTIPAVMGAPVDLSKTFEIKSGGVNATIVASTNPVTAPFRIGSVAWLIEENHFSALVQLVPTGAPPMSSTGVVEPTYDKIKERFDAQVKESLAVPDGDKTWVAIRKDVISLATNSVVQQAGLCLTTSVDVPNQHSDNEIKLPDGLGIDCSPTAACDARQCTFSQTNHDERSCNVCLIPNIFTGGCTQRGNDPICEAAKASQNAIYAADANLRKADCDRLAIQEKTACEAGKVATKALCETKKEALNALARTGKFGNLVVDASMQTSNMKVCLKDFQLSTGLERVQFALDVQGSANVKVKINFMPLDIVGHIACVMDWSTDKTFTASLRDSRVGIGADIGLVTGNDGFRANAKIGNIDIKAKLDPGPTAFLVSSPDLLLKCPVLAAIAPTVVILTPFVPQLRGEIDYTLPEQQVSMKLAVPEQQVGGAAVGVQLTSTPVSLVAIGTISSKP
jgi:hypothetical protein